MAKAIWALYPTHSEVQFKVKHLMITNVTGQFNVISASLAGDDETFQQASVTFSADVQSINTANEQRDGHLKSADFFDATQFPTLTFEAAGFNATSGKVKGNLTIKGITKPVELDVEFSGVNKDPWGNQKAGFSISGKINRTHWGLNWNAPLEAGGVLVSEEVRLQAEVQFVKQA
ncbi:MAG: YceI family protein [Cyclobacteriaceae bacterium]|jgi:polyisoprenoid-binding protein YceI|nr:YceI family protein [Cyclobacteriaceae bacterium]